MQPFLFRFVGIFFTCLFFAIDPVGATSYITLPLEQIVSKADVIVRVQCIDRTVVPMDQIDRVEVIYTFELKDAPEYGNVSSVFDISYSCSQFRADNFRVLTDFDFTVSHQYFVALQYVEQDTTIIKIAGNSSGVFPIFFDSSGHAVVHSQSIDLTSQSATTAENKSDEIRRKSVSVEEFTDLVADLTKEGD